MPGNPVVILTRESEDNRPLARQLQLEDIYVLDYPCIRTTLQPYRRGSKIDGFELADFGAVVFTSRRGVAGMAEVYPDLATSGQFLAVVGKGTATAVNEKIGKPADLVADPATGEALARMLVQSIPPGHRILHVRGNKTTGTFQRIVQGAGFALSSLIVYRNEMPTPAPLEVPAGGAVVLASPSAAKCFLHHNPHLKDKLDYLAIGPVTSGYLQERGVERIFEAPKPSPDSLAREIKKIMNRF